MSEKITKELDGIQLDNMNDIIMDKLNDLDVEQISNKIIHNIKFHRLHMECHREHREMYKILNMHIITILIYKHRQ